MYTCNIAYVVPTSRDSEDTCSVCDVIKINISHFVILTKNKSDRQADRDTMILDAE